MKYIRSIVSATIVTLIVSGSAFSQKSSRGREKQSQTSRINKTLPGVYLIAERIGTHKIEGQRPESLVWFRLKNNTRFGIRIHASGGIEEIEDAGFYYEKLDKKGSVIDSRLCHVCSIITIHSGKDILFTVPYEPKAEAASLRVQFSYDWEDDLDVEGGRESVHYVMYYFRYLLDDLPSFEDLILLPDPGPRK